ncbi:hypothetical protein F0562_033468 [Nyssa sinensis]|uniref:Homeobox domain-containing protein n=1 Tax=Nyssa sinensis TaxID=561372 RepID=A0A5J5AFL1_9ASTE|nr:hypothetical protein F0562_033468 [Nyssa sinensis]
MWMMGCGDGSEFNMPDSLSGRKLRPLIPKPPTASPQNTTHSAVTTPTYWSCSCSTDYFAVNHHLATATQEQSKTDMNSTEPLVSSRWNPTPEQLSALEEMYRGGTRTPTAEQIQQIAAKLRRFGKIEGKNVFYWFQNHKARERQKRRRPILDSGSEEQLCYLEGKESELSRAGFEVRQKKNWATPSNCSTSSEECVSIHRAVAAESRPDGWTQFEERELQQSSSSSLRANHATWLSCTPPTNLSNITATTESEAFGITDPKLSTNTQNFNRERINFANIEDENRQSQTLQLFPLRSNGWNAINDAENTEVPITNIDINFTPNQFFEFL